MFRYIELYRPRDASGYTETAACMQLRRQIRGRFKESLYRGSKLLQFSPARLLFQHLLRVEKKVRANQGFKIKKYCVSSRTMCDYIFEIIFLKIYFYRNFFIALLLCIYIYIKFRNFYNIIILLHVLCNRDSCNNLISCDIIIMRQIRLSCHSN